MIYGKSIYLCDGDGRKHLSCGSANFAGGWPGS